MRLLLAGKSPRRRKTGDGAKGGVGERVKVRRAQGAGRGA